MVCVRLFEDAFEGAFGRLVSDIVKGSAEKRSMRKALFFIGLMGDGVEKSDRNLDILNRKVSFLRAREYLFGRMMENEPCLKSLSLAVMVEIEV